MGTRIHNPERIGRQALAFVLTLALGFILGMATAPADAAERQQARNAAVLDVVLGDYGSDRTELTPYEVAALLPVYAVDEHTGDNTCWAQTVYLLGTRNYEPAMWGCLGDEDAPAVDVILGG